MTGEGSGKVKTGQKEQNRENPITTTRLREVTLVKHLAKEVYKLLPRNASFNASSYEAKILSLHDIQS